MQDHADFGDFTSSCFAEDGYKCTALCQTARAVLFFCQLDLLFRCVIVYRRRLVLLLTRDF